IGGGPIGVCAAPAPLRGFHNAHDCRGDLVCDLLGSQAQIDLQQTATCNRPISAIKLRTMMDASRPRGEWVPRSRFDRQVLGAVASCTSLFG
ncbi:MAG: hypothetical protein ACREVS_16410, partial [Burkholderiales bacterium]